VRPRGRLSGCLPRGLVTAALQVSSRAWSLESRVWISGLRAQGFMTSCLAGAEKNPAFSLLALLLLCRCCA